MSSTKNICPNDSTNNCNSNPCASGEVLICHMKNNGEMVELCVRENQVQRHLDHGDSLGSCSVPRNEELNKSDIVLYPNPSDGKFAISFKNTNFVGATVTVHNSFGVTLFQKQILDIEKVSVDITNKMRQEGIYFVIFKKMGQTVAIPIVISK